LTGRLTRRMRVERHVASQENFVKVLETTELDFNRYGDTLFEVLFTGGRVVAGGDKEAEGTARVDYNVLSVGIEKESIKPFVKQFAVILRRRPFLVKNLEAVLKQVSGAARETEWFEPHLRWTDFEGGTTKGFSGLRGEPQRSVRCPGKGRGVG
jgi:hypothetical protein